MKTIAAITKLALAIVVGVVLVATGTDLAARPASADHITVRCDQALSINGFEQIERQLFGLTAYESPNVVEAPESRHFSEWGVECLGLAGNFNWVLPQDAKPLDAAGVDAWFAEAAPDAKNARWFMTKYPAPDRYVAGRIVPLLATDHVEPFVYLLGLVPGSVDANRLPADFNLWARFAGHYVTLLKGLEPKLKYVHLTNEPNGFWFKSGKYGADYAQLLNSAAKAIHEKSPDVQVGGPVLNWPPTWPPHQTGQKDWYTWEFWSKGVIDGCGENLAFFDWHSYDVDPQAIEGELHIVTAYARVKQGRWLRNAITEINYKLSKADWKNRDAHYRQRVLPMMREFMIALRNPDKVFNQQVHDFNAWVTDPGCYRWRPDADGKPTPMMELYRIFKPLRGLRLAVENAPDSIMVEAATQGNQMAVALANLGGKPWTGVLEMRNLDAGQVAKVSAWTLDVTSLRPVEGLALGGAVTLAPESITVVTFELNQSLEPAKRLLREEFFADAVMQPIPADGKLKFAFLGGSGPQTKVESAAIRLGFKGPSSTIRWTLSIDGQDVVVDNPGAFTEIRLARPPQQWPVQLTLQRQGTPGDLERANLLSFASIVLDRTVAR
jgi:hypothetical protein